MSVSLLKLVTIFVDPKDFSKELAFFTAVLKELGGNIVSKYPNGAVIFGRDNKVEFILSPSGSSINNNPVRLPTNAFYFAFSASSVQQIENAFKAGLENGGISNGDTTVARAVAPDVSRAYIVSPCGHNVGLFIE